MTQLSLATSQQRIDVPTTIARSLAPIGVVLLVAWGMDYLGQKSGAYATQIMLNVGVAIIAAVSLTIVNGFTGQFSIGHAAFMTIGGYTAAMVTYYFLLSRGWEPNAIRNLAPSWFGGGQFLLAVACLVGGLVSALCGFVVGLPSLRLRGDYLAIVTLGFGEIVRVLLQQTRSQIDSVAALKEVGMARALLPPHANGALGFNDLPPLANLPWIYFFVGLTVLAAYRIKTSSYGRALLSIREDEIAAESMGVNVAKLKVRAFVLAAFFAGIAGALYAHEPGNKLTPGDAGFQRSFEVVMMVVLGGLGSISGSVLAAILITVAGEWLRQPTHVWHVGLILIVIRVALGLANVMFPRASTLRACLTLAGVVAAVEFVRWLALYLGINLGDYRMIAFALMLILLMIFRPSGLLGLREIWELFSLPRRRGDAERRAVP
jgi:branched-chain amino acid transport system permease protein